MRPSEKAALERLAHPFEYQWDHGNRCVHFHNWLGGFVVCGLKENDPMHTYKPSGEAARKEGGE